MLPSSEHIRTPKEQPDYESRVQITNRKSGITNSRVLNHKSQIRITNFRVRQPLPYRAIPFVSPFILVASHHG